MSERELAKRSEEYNSYVSAREYADTMVHNARKDPDIKWGDLELAKIWGEAMEYALQNPTLIKEPSFFDTVPNIAQEELDVIENFSPKED